MGLLDVLNSEDGRLGLGLLAAGSARSDGAGLGQRLSEAIGSVDQWKQQQEAARFRKMQQEHMAMQMAQAQEQIARQKRIQEGAGQFFKPAQPAYQPMDSMLPPEMRTGAQPMPAKPASVDTQGLGMFLAREGDIESGLKLLQPKQPDYKVVGGSLVQIGQDGVKPVFTDAKEPSKPTAIQEYEYAKTQGYPGTFQQFQEGLRKAGASSVSVNTGQKGFDNTLKLRGDFRSEPIYKAHQEVQSAYAQIQQSLKQASPAGDLAGATKIMKMLDPGSVVRESELGMAMAATGVLDRLQNYAGMVINGTKLTPSQRVDFQRLADALYSESAKQYNAKQSEYRGIAERNGLNIPDVVGDTAKFGAAKKVVKTGTYGGRKVVQYEDGSTAYAD